MKKTLYIMMISAFVLASCTGGGDKKQQPVTGNPLLDEWNTPHGVPPFEQIKNEHYMPAFEAAMQAENEEIEAIVSNNEEPTFENTIVALDNSGGLLSKVSAVFYGVNGANTNPELQKISTELSPLLSKHGDDISLNPVLFQRVKAVYDKKDGLGLTTEQMILLDRKYKSFIRGGAALDEEKQEELRRLNTEISALQLKFGQNLLAETSDFKLVIDNDTDLEGLPENIRLAAAARAEKDGMNGKWVFGLDNPSIMPFLQYANNRALREKMFNAYINRCNNNNDADNKAVVARLVELRLQKANLLGYPTFADFVLEDKMAKTPAAVYNLLNQIWTPALAMAKTELAEMQAMINKGTPKFELQGWDWRYYENLVRNEKFNLSEETLRPYFKIENVRDGIFYVCDKLYGIKFAQVDLPKYHPDVQTFECYDKDGSLLGILYMDYFARPGQKRGGAWCGSFRRQSMEDGKRVIPVVTIVCNFSAPVGEQPSLLTTDETETFFHEFGHALHNLFSNCNYRGLSATSVPRDFVELPSQVMEHWAFEPEVLNVYAKHYQTGEVIPAELVEKLEKSSKYGEGFKTTELTAAALLDMDYHVLTQIPANFDVLKFETDKMNAIGLIKQIPPRYRTTYFNHTMAGGYTAGYYSYLWSEVLDADAFQAYVEKGDIFDQETATKFRNYILSRGGTEDAMTMYKNFRGAEPGIDALLKNRGLK